MGVLAGGAGCGIEDEAVLAPALAFDRGRREAPPDSGLQLQTVSAGSAHSCGLTAGGLAYCWGTSIWGALGDGGPYWAALPVAVASNTAFKTIVAKGNTTCALGVLGEAYCWGYRLGSNQPVKKPAAIPGNLIYTSISLGDYHACAVAWNGAGYCWGMTVTGALGNGAMAVQDTVPGPVAGGIVFANISAGYRHSCGVATDGTAYCWGQNRKGVLGVGSSDTLLTVTTPKEVVGGLSFASIEVGASHNCGVTASGDGYCWGQNKYGGLGNGAPGNDEPAPVLVAGSIAWQRITPGGYQAERTCGVSTGGQGYCWGEGVGTPQPLAAPASWLTIHAGIDHTCGIAGNGYAYCWGMNNLAQLGNGTWVNSAVPTPVKAY